MQNFNDICWSVDYPFPCSVWRQGFFYLIYICNHQTMLTDPNPIGQCFPVLLLGRKFEWLLKIYRTPHGCLLWMWRSFRVTFKKHSSFSHLDIFICHFLISIFSPFQTMWDHQAICPFSTSIFAAWGGNRTLIHDFEQGILQVYNTELWQ